MTPRTVDELTVRRPGTPLHLDETPVAKAKATVKAGWRGVTSPLRRLPDWLVIGAQKAGTTSLAEYLGTHSQVRSAELKEIDYFTWFYDRPLRWYRGFFPLERTCRSTGEASPSYLYDPRVPARVAKTLPDVRLIAVLRDPVDRAFSHYHHERKRGFEPLDFEAALAAEPDRLIAEHERVGTDPGYVSMRLRHWSYLDRGLYAQQLRGWLEHFPQEGVHVVCAEEMFADPAAVYSRALEFLGLPDEPLPAFPPLNANAYSPLADGLKARLGSYFEDANEELFVLLGRRLDWTRADGSRPAGAER